MAQINQLSSQTTVVGSDLLPIYSSENWDARKISVSALLAFFQSAFAAPNVAVQFAVPATGFNLNIASGSTSTWLLMQPVATLATGTVTLPLNTSVLDGAEVLITSTQQITILTLSGNGATAVYGAPASVGADSGFRMRYYLNTNSWYKIA
jgi:hypothetical protein